MHDELRDAVRRAGMELSAPHPDLQQIQRDGKRALVVRKTGAVVLGVASLASVFALYPSFISDRRPSNVSVGPSGASCRPNVDVGEITGDGGRHTTKALTPNVEIASGEQQGLDWSLCAYRAMVTIDDKEPEPALCEEFRYGLGPGAGSACSVGVNATVPSHWHYFQRFSDPTEEEGVAFSGAISDRVDKVVLQLDDRSDLEARIYEPPEELGVNYRFFVGFAPQGSDVIVVVLDAEGNELEREARRGRP